MNFFNRATDFAKGMGEQLQEITREALTEAQDEVDDPETEVAVIKSRNNELAACHESDQNIIRDLEMKLQEAINNYETANAQVQQDRLHYRQLLDERDATIAKLQRDTALNSKTTSDWDSMPWEDEFTSLSLDSPKERHRTTSNYEEIEMHSKSTQCVIDDGKKEPTTDTLQRQIDELKTENQSLSSQIRSAKSLEASTRTETKDLKSRIALLDAQLNSRNDETQSMLQDAIAKADLLQHENLEQAVKLETITKQYDELLAVNAQVSSQDQSHELDKHQLCLQFEERIRTIQDQYNAKENELDSTKRQLNKLMKSTNDERQLMSEQIQQAVDSRVTQMQAQLNEYMNTIENLQKEKSKLEERLLFEIEELRKSSNQQDLIERSSMPLNNHKHQENSSQTDGSELTATIIRRYRSIVGQQAAKVIEMRDLNVGTISAAASRSSSSRASSMAETWDRLPDIGDAARTHIYETIVQTSVNNADLSPEVQPTQISPTGSNSSQEQLQGTIDKMTTEIESLRLEKVEIEKMHHEQVLDFQQRIHLLEAKADSTTNESFPTAFICPNEAQTSNNLGDQQRIDQLTSERDELAQRIEYLEYDLKQIRYESCQLKDNSNQLVKVKEELEQLMAQYVELQSTHDACESRIASYAELEQQLLVYQQQANTDAEQIRSRDDEIAKITKLVDEVRNEQQRLVEQNSKLDAHLHEVVDDTTEKMAIKDVQIEELQNNLAKSHTQLEQYVKLEDEHQISLTQIDDLKSQITMLESECDQLKAECEVKSNDHVQSEVLESLRLELTKVKQEYDDCLRMREESQRELLKLSEQANVAEHLQSEIATLRQANNQFESELEEAKKELNNQRTQNSQDIYALKQELQKEYIELNNIREAAKHKEQIINDQISDANVTIQDLREQLHNEKIKNESYQESSEQVMFLSQALAQAQQQHQELSTSYEQCYSQLQIYVEKVAVASKDQKQLASLREHLAQMEKEYSAELNEAEQRETILRQQLADKDREILTVCDRAHQQECDGDTIVADLRKQNSELIARNTALDADLNTFRDRYEESTSDLTAARALLNEIRNDDGDAKRIQRDREKLYAQIENLNSQLSAAQTELSEVTERSKDQLNSNEKLNEEITFLRQREVDLLQKQQIEQSKAASCSNDVEKELVRNMVMNLIMAPDDKMRADISLLLGTILNFSKEDLNKVASMHGGHGWLASLLGSDKHPSIATQFVQFLQQESEQTICTSSAPPPLRIEDTAPRSPSHPPNVSDASQVMPTFADDESINFIRDAVQ